MKNYYIHLAEIASTFIYNFLTLAVQQCRHYEHSLPSTHENSGCPII